MSFSSEYIWCYILILLGVVHGFATLYDSIALTPLFFGPLGDLDLRDQLSGTFVKLWPQHLLIAGRSHLDLSFHRARILVCVYAWASALVAWTHWFFLPAIGLTLVGIGISVSLLKGLQSGPLHSPRRSESLVQRHYHLLRIGVLPMLIAGGLHLFVTLIYPQTFAPTSPQVYHEMT